MLTAVLSEPAPLVCLSTNHACLSTTACISPAFLCQCPCSHFAFCRCISGVATLLYNAAVKQLPLVTAQTLGSAVDTVPLVVHRHAWQCSCTHLGDASQQHAFAKSELSRVPQQNQIACMSCHAQHIALAVASTVTRPCSV